MADDRDKDTTFFERRVLPSLASADPLNLGGCIRDLGDYPYLHLDVEDGNFISNITFGMKTIRAAARAAKQELDAHLMVSDPRPWVEELLAAGIRNIAFHAETQRYPYELLHRIREAGGRGGLAFNFMEDPAAALWYLDELDYVLIMTSEPDGQDQLFRPELIRKVKAARQMFPAGVSICVDGGVSPGNMMQLAQAGADAFVMGRAVWNTENPGETAERICRMLNRSGKAEAGIRERGMYL